MYAKQILIFKDNFPYKAVSSTIKASFITKVPDTTIRHMIKTPPIKQDDIHNGGRSTPNGWGFDYLA